MFLRLNIEKIDCIYKLSKYGIRVLLKILRCDCDGNEYIAYNEFKCYDDPEINCNFIKNYTKCYDDNKYDYVELNDKYKMKRCEVRQGILELFQNNIILIENEKRYILNTEVLEYRANWGECFEANNMSNFVQFCVDAYIIDRLYKLPLAAIRVMFKCVEGLHFSTWDELNINLNKELRNKIAKELNIKECTINKSISQLVKCNVIVKIKNGKYMINPDLFYKGKIDEKYKVREKYRQHQRDKNLKKEEIKEEIFVQPFTVCNLDEYEEESCSKYDWLVKKLTQEENQRRGIIYRETT